MIKINGEKIEQKLPTYTWIVDIIFFDGPLLSLFKSDRSLFKNKVVNIDALFVWLDCDDKKNRWAIIEITQSSLRKYLLGDLSLLSIFEEIRHLIIFETTSTHKKLNIKKVSLENFPKEYLPSNDSFLTPNIATDEAISLKKELLSEYIIKLDGEFYMGNLSTIFNVYQQLYSFHYALTHLKRDAIQDTLKNAESWKSGKNSANIFTKLNDAIPSFHREKIVSLNYNSPGHIKMQLLTEVAKNIYDTNQSLYSANRQTQAEALYKKVYDYLKQHKISGFEERSSSVRKSSNLSEEQLIVLDKFTQEFIEIFSWQEHSEKINQLQLEPLAKLRVFLAYYRRIQKLKPYQDNGLIELMPVS